MAYNIEILFKRYPELSCVKNEILEAISIIRDAFKNGNRLYICGNGGSAADAEHIVGELMKGFLMKRELPTELINRFEGEFGEEGKSIAINLQQGLPAIALTSHPALSTAFNNDVDPSLTFAQQLFSLAKSGDVLLAITTSGNSDNILKALKVAKILGVNTITLTGKDGGKSKELSECTIVVPSNETYMIQELHLPIYHALCADLEESFYGKN
jgi:D-sedoheptulose 7-phosphate isomerase